MMSEKIVITVEQNERIEAFLKVATKKGHVLINHIDGWVSEENKKLNTLSIDQMARILYEPNSYEVEHKYKVGDWVAMNNGEVFYQSRKQFEKVQALEDGLLVLSNSLGLFTLDYVRHATKEEIIFFELGREVGEFVEGDGGRDINGHLYRNIDTIKTIYNKGQLKGFYPANSFIKLP